MAASLEQIQILSREYDLAEHEYQKALDAMRRLVTSAKGQIISEWPLDVIWSKKWTKTFLYFCLTPLKQIKSKKMQIIILEDK